LIKFFQIYSQFIPLNVAGVLKDDGASDRELYLSSQESYNTLPDLVVIRNNTSVTGVAAGYRQVTVTKLMRYRDKTGEIP
jgi:uncharacterized protein YjdB